MNLGQLLKLTSRSTSSLALQAAMVPFCRQRVLVCTATHLQNPLWTAVGMQQRECDISAGGSGASPACKVQHWPGHSHMWYLAKVWKDQG